MQLTRFITCLVLSLGAFSSSLWAMPPALHVVGNKIETLSGNCPVRLVGVDIDSLEWAPLGYGPWPSNAGGITTTVQEAIDYWHVNFIRIPLSQDFWNGTGNSKSSGYSYPWSQAQYQALVDTIVSMCNAANIYVDLDLHWSGTGSYGTAVQQNSMPDQNSPTFWESLAARYANNPSVLFDLYNEPYPNTWAVWKNGGTANEGFATPGLQALLNDIRSTTASGTLASGGKAENVCIAGGLAYSYVFADDQSCAAMSPLVDVAGGNGVMYAAHIYNNKAVNAATPATGVNCGGSWSSGGGWSGTGGGWEYNIDPALAYGPVVVEEFGNSANTTDNGAFVNTIVTFLNGTNDQNYLYNGMSWDLCTVAGPELITNWSTTLQSPTAGGTTWPLTSYEGQSVFNWLSGVTQASCGTATDTPTDSPTSTSTKTGTPTDSPTPTSTKTGTPTDSPTATPTGSPTSTSTQTGTPTDSPTFTASPTSTSTTTVTFTASPTPTFSSSPTGTPTATATVTHSPTVTSTDSPSVTDTYSVSPTSTSSSTATASGTTTSTVTASATFTDTPPYTATDTMTPATDTPSPTDSDTFSPSMTPSASATPSPSASPTSTSSSTITVTDSPSASSTATDTASSTFSPSPTATPCVTDSATPTPTFSVTASFSATSSVTFSSTGTLTPSATATPTATPDYSATETPVVPVLDPITQQAPPGVALDVTLTGSNFSVSDQVWVASVPYTPIGVVGGGTGLVFALRAQSAGNVLTVYVQNSAGKSASRSLTIEGAGPDGPLDIVAVSVIPNPNPRYLSIDLAGPADSVTVRVFTKALVLALQFNRNTLAGGWNSFAFPTAWESLSGGLYYVQVSARRGTTRSAPQFVKVLLLK